MTVRRAVEEFLKSASRCRIHKEPEILCTCSDCIAMDAAAATLRSTLDKSRSDHPRFIPVSEELPYEGVVVLAAFFYKDRSPEFHAGKILGGSWGDNYGGEWLARPTHWMHMPVIPRDESYVFAETAETVKEDQEYIDPPEVV